jgi:UDP-N-acetylmuramoyl-tripeptide--D-alanyl-D-alanine ligase
LCNISIEKTIRGIFEFKNCKNRGEKIKIGKIDVIDDTYNASFESVKSAIESLAEMSYALNKKPFALIGTMLEMGEKSSDFHKKIGEFSREKGILNLFVLGEYSKEIIEGFGGGISFRTKEEAIIYIAENLGEGDMLLVKASHAERFEKIIEGLKEKLNEN